MWRKWRKERWKSQTRGGGVDREKLYTSGGKVQEIIKKNNCNHFLVSFSSRG